MEALAEAFSSIGVAMVDKTFMGNLQDLFTLLQEPEEIPRFATNLGASFVPNIIRSSARLADPYERDVSYKGERMSPEWMKDAILTKGGYYMFPYRPEDASPLPKYDFYGNKIVKAGGTTPATDLFYKMSSLTGVPITTRKQNDITRMIMNWNNGARYDYQFKNKVTGKLDTYGSYWISKPEKILTVGQDRMGKDIKISLTDKQYQDYVRMIGERFTTFTKDATFNIEKPTVGDILRLKRIRERATGLARRQLLAKIRRGEQ